MNPQGDSSATNTKSARSCAGSSRRTSGTRTCRFWQIQYLLLQSWQHGPPQHAVTKVQQALRFSANIHMHASQSIAQELKARLYLSNPHVGSPSGYPKNGYLSLRNEPHDVARGLPPASGVESKTEAHKRLHPICNPFNVSGASAPQPL